MPGIYKNWKKLIINGALFKKASLNTTTGSISFVLEEAYDKLEYQSKINIFLKNFHIKNQSFQQHFNRPVSGNHAPYLTLSENSSLLSKNPNEEDLLKFIKDIFSKKKVKEPSIKKLIAKDKEQTTNKSIPSLKNAIERLSIKKLIVQGKLFTKASLDQLGNISFGMAEFYNRQDVYLKINTALKSWYIKSKLFKTYFSKPSEGKHIPSLTLAENSPLCNSNLNDDALLEKIKELATEKLKSRPTPFKALIAQGALFTRASIDNNKKILLSINEDFAESKNHTKINHTLYDWYQNNETFRNFFKKPILGNHEPFLELEQNSPLLKQDLTNDSILEKLQEMALGHKSATPVSFRKLIANNQLFKNASVDNSGKITFTVLEPYDNKKDYLKINTAFYKWYHSHKAFQQLFEVPSRANHPPCLNLNKNNPIFKGQEITAEIILEKIQTLAKDKSDNRPLSSRLKYNDLIQEIKIENNIATLLMFDKQKNANNLNMLQKAFYQLYISNQTFRCFFEKPSTSFLNQVPTLTLTPNNPLKNGAQVYDLIKLIVTIRSWKPNYATRFYYENIQARKVLNMDDVCLVNFDKIIEKTEFQQYDLPKDIIETCLAYNFYQLVLKDKKNCFIPEEHDNFNIDLSVQGCFVTPYQAFYDFIMLDIPSSKRAWHLDKTSEITVIKYPIEVVQNTYDEQNENVTEFQLNQQNALDLFQLEGEPNGDESYLIPSLCEENKVDYLMFPPPPIINFAYDTKETQPPSLADIEQDLLSNYTLTFHGLN